MGSCTSSPQVNETRDLNKTLQPIARDFVDIFCSVDPKNHCMSNEILSAFFHFALTRGVDLNRINIARFEREFARLMVEHVPEFSRKGMHIRIDGGSTFIGACTGLKLKHFP